MQVYRLMFTSEKGMAMTVIIDGGSHYAISPTDKVPIGLSFLEIYAVVAKSISLVEVGLLFMPIQ